MSVPTMEELVETFDKAANAAWAEKFDLAECRLAGMSAVLDRLKPVVAAALIEANGITQYSIGRPTADARATRIIDQIKGA